jgi:hypothetical protein
MESFFQTQPVFRLALPNGEHFPTDGLELLLHARISQLVACDLGPPEPFVGSGWEASLA